MRFRWACLLVCVGLPAHADEVVLKGGRSLFGEVVGRTATTVTIEIAPGRVTFPLSAVDHISSGPSALGAFRERSQRLAQDDAAGWLALALWARDHGLATQANEAFERVTAIDPANATAQQALGRVRVGDQWMAREDGYRAQGLVELQGEWLTPQERDARLVQARTEAEIERQRIESEAKVREAEARAREAEAEARRAEAEATAPVVPFWMSAGFPRQREHDGDGHGRGSHGHQPAPTPQATPVRHDGVPPKPPHASPTPSRPATGAARPDRPAN